MSDENLLKAYTEYLALSDKLLGEGIRALEIAPIMVRLGLEIYKTAMPEDDYNRMVDYISDMRDEINDLSDTLPEIH